jgi:Tol biopolymer transport system component
MGVVYRATDLELGRSVALKRPLTPLPPDSKERKRFLREARASSRLQHPSIVTLFEVFQEGEYDWLAMELVEGKSLREVIAERGGLSQAEVLRYGEQLADALKVAHAGKVIHRDIKSSNILIDRNNLAKLTDFGLARFQHTAAEVDSRSPTKSMPLTRSGQVLGTPAYMSPEQLLGGELDSRADLFSIGCVLYEMCTGRPPFARDSEARTMDAILHEEARPVLLVNQEIGTELNRIIGKCLAKRPDERYQSAEDLRTDLRTERRRLESTEYASEHKAGETRRRPIRWRLLTVGLVLTAAAVAVYVGLIREASPRLPEAKPYHVTTAPGWEADVAISPDGKLLAYASDEAGGADIFVIDARGGTPLRLTQGQGIDRAPTWFPDGRAIAFHSLRNGQTDIWKISHLGGSPTMLVPQGAHPAISPDGTRIAYEVPGEEGEPRIAVADLDNPTNATVLTGPDDGMWGHLDPAWSPDGTLICYSDFENLWVVPTSGGKAHRITTGDGSDREPVWSSDGRHIYFSSYREGTLAIWRMPSRGGDLERITLGSGPERHPSLSRDGTRLAYSTYVKDTDVVLMDLQTGAEATLPGTGINWGARISPDRSWLVFISNRNYRSSIYRQSISGVETLGSPLRLNDEIASSSNPEISPDGNWVAYQRQLGKDRNIWVVESSGGMPRPVTVGEGVRIHPAWSPDGSRIAYLEETEGRSELKVTSFREDGSQPVTVATAGNLMWPVWSPDGSEIAYLKAVDGEWDIWISPVAAMSEPRRITTGAELGYLCWNHSNGQLWASGFWGEGELSLREVDPRTGRIEPVDVNISFGAAAIDGEIDISADGLFLAYTRDSVTGDLWVLETVSGSY